MLIKPSAPPKQLTFATIPLIVMSNGWVMVLVIEDEHPLISVTVTIYVLGGSPIYDVPDNIPALGEIE